MNFPFRESVTHFHRKLAPNDGTGSKKHCFTGPAADDVPYWRYCPHLIIIMTTWSSSELPFRESATPVFTANWHPMMTQGKKKPIVLLARLQRASLSEDAFRIIIINDLKQGHTNTVLALCGTSLSMNLSLIFTVKWWNRVSRALFLLARLQRASLSEYSFRITIMTTWNRVTQT